MEKRGALEFKELRKKLLKLSLVSIGTTFISLATVGLKIFYPFHVILGIGIYILSFIPLIRRIYFSRKIWKQYRAYKYAKIFYRKEKVRIIYAVLLVCFSVAFLWLRPLDQNPFKAMSNYEIKQMVSDDLYRSVTAMDYLETTGNELLAELKSEEESSLRTADIGEKFDEFLGAVAYSEYLTDRHRYFAIIPYRLWQSRVDSFLISYSLYVKKYEIIHRVMREVTESEYEKKALNQYMRSFGRGVVYNEMIVRFYEPKTRLRLSLGYLYMKLFADPEDEDSSARLLYNKADHSYKYLRSNIFSTLTHSMGVLLDHTEIAMFDSWFPIQKGVANAMGKAILSTRGKEGIIREDESLEMGESMLPGDIMLQRRNWHLSNVGIPGFWTHAALYTGSLEEMEKYFNSDFPMMGYPDFREYFAEEYPEVYSQYLQLDSWGYPISVVEAIDPKVLLQSLPKSADADFVVVLRPSKLSKQDRLMAITRAWDNLGKPYDYNFDFDTLNELVCSEVVYDAYLSVPAMDKMGIQFETSLVSGRKMVSPLDIARKFKYEYGDKEAELSFVYFLMGNEETRTTSKGDVGDFLESVYWSKFTFFQNSR